MYFDPENKVVKLCAEGMMAEWDAPNTSNALFEQAWQIAANDLEKCIAAHYIAHRQQDKAESLKWNKLSLTHAVAADDEQVKEFFPSLYLNIGKSYEDLGEYTSAKENYLAAKNCISQLADDGYGRMIAGGIEAGIERCRENANHNC